MTRVSVIGATGYTGGELLRILIRHPNVTLSHLTSETQAGKAISDIHKFLKGQCALPCEKLSIPTIAKDSDFVFLCLPHGEAARTGAALYEKGLRVIDLSADFRLEDAKTFARWYGEHPVPSLLKAAVYGLPERHREEIKNSRLVANPGCYATTTILAGLPLMTEGLLGNGPIIVDAKSGISGAGRKLESTYLYSEANETMQAYSLKGHRHHPEVLQEWHRAQPKKSKKIEMIFVPHLVPMTRGIFSTVYAPLKKKMTAEALRDIYLQFYLREPFVTVLPAGQSPEVRSVAFSNNCHIGVALDESGMYAIIMAALDNLVKGASGQAVQNMNLMLGIDERTGLL